MVFFNQLLLEATAEQTSETASSAFPSVWEVVLQPLPQASPTPTWQATVSFGHTLQPTESKLRQSARARGDRHSIPPPLPSYGRARLQVRRVAETKSLPREGQGVGGGGHEKKLVWLYLSNGGKKPRNQHITESVPNGWLNISYIDKHSQSCSGLITLDL